jgi:hypothetical protein
MRICSLISVFLGYLLIYIFRPYFVTFLASKTPSWDYILALNEGINNIRPWSYKKSPPPLIRQDMVLWEGMVLSIRGVLCAK